MRAPHQNTIAAAAAAATATAAAAAAATAAAAAQCRDAVVLAGSHRRYDAVQWRRQQRRG